MGYETLLLIGKRCLKKMEIEKDMEHPFKDGSGFQYKKDRDGKYVETGREEEWFQIYAQLDCCKLGYEDNQINKLISKTHESGRMVANKKVVYCYGLDGNQRFTEDRYGDPLYAAPIKDVLKAFKSSRSKDNPYRRVEWAIALLNSMAKDTEDLEVIFFGH